MRTHRDLAQPEFWLRSSERSHRRRQLLPRARREHARKRNMSAALAGAMLAGPGASVAAAQMSSNVKAAVAGESPANRAIEIREGGLPLQLGSQGDRGVLPWSDPVVWTSAMMLVWLLAAALFNAVYKPARKGRKVAYLTVVSFVFLIISLSALLLIDTQHGGQKSERPRQQGAAVQATDRLASFISLTGTGNSSSTPLSGGAR